MSTVGQKERRTQTRVIKLFRERLGYDFLGNWIDREDNRNVEENLLRDWLAKRGVNEALITRALHQLGKDAALGEGKNLYDANRAVYDLLRYGIIETPEKYYLTWKEESDIDNLLDRHLIQLCNKPRLLEIIHDFIVFDAGIKKTCRHSL